MTSQSHDEIVVTPRDLSSYKQNSNEIETATPLFYGTFFFLSLLNADSFETENIVITIGNILQSGLQADICLGVVSPHPPYTVQM